MGFFDDSFANVGAGQISRPSVRVGDGGVDSHDVGLDFCDRLGSGLSGTRRASNGDGPRSRFHGTGNCVAGATEMA